MIKAHAHHPPCPPLTGGKVPSPRRAFLSSREKHGGFYSRDTVFIPCKCSTGGSSREKSKQGFTLLELLIVLAILAVLLGIAVNNYQRYRSRLELREAQQVLVQELNRARSDAKRLSAHQSVAWTDKTITIGVREVKLSASGNVTLVKLKGSNTLTYFAPYGRVNTGEYEFELRGRSDLTSTVHVYGVTGKVKATQ